MNILVAYYTKYGNGKIIAEAITRGLRESGNEATIINIPAKDICGDYDFIVVSSPTRFGKMMKPVRKFIKKNLSGDVWRGKPFIAVGTGYRPEEIDEETGKSQPEQYADGSCGPAESAEQLYEELENAGLKPAADPQKFYVKGLKGPLADGEENRALDFGLDKGRELAGR